MIVMLEVSVMIEKTLEYVKQIFANDCSGHDYYHMITSY